MGCNGSSAKKDLKMKALMYKEKRKGHDPNSQLIMNAYHFPLLENQFVMKASTHVFDPYEVMERLGKGGFATVRLAKYKGINEYMFAMKSMRKVVDEVDMTSSIINELNLLNKLDHPNIANFNEAYQEDEYIHAILEFSPGKSLAQLYSELKEPLPLIDTLKIFYQIFKTAAYLMKKKIIHRDYKPPNIMVEKTQNSDYFGYQIQLIDFGFSRTYQDSLNDKMVMGSPHYVAPESLNQEYSYSADVWSIGIMLYFSICFRYPFEDTDEEELFRKIQEQELSFHPKETWDTVPEELKDLVKMMLEKDPMKRIHIKDIPVHPAFKQIHEIEDSVTITEENRDKLSRYFTRLNAMERKFLKYSTKFLCPSAKTEYCEKFTLLDKNNTGTLNFFPDSPKTNYMESDTSKGNSDSLEVSKESQKYYKVTYSDYLAAIIHHDVICGEVNVELLFHTLNPAYMTDIVMKNEMRDALFLGNNNKKEEKMFDKLKCKTRSGKEVISKEWVMDYYDKIYKKLDRDPDESESSDEEST
ncbi:unnamed protein product [Moneuplotes crassus]|uniref:Protein kinase domain-containing protein n=1 Tax=Euplotes crassus TaxID=5936 RepID=A0AAD1UCW3_EUPCR|nr:unnamed protein product [Moneuplotes crassus]